MIRNHLVSILLLGFSFLIVSKGALAATELPPLNSPQELLDYLEDFIPVAVFPEEPDLDNSEASFDAYSTYSWDSITRFESVLSRIGSGLPIFQNPRLTNLAQVLIESYKIKSAQLRAFHETVNWNSHYSSHYSDGIVIPLRQMSSDFLAKLRVYADKYAPENTIPDREIAIEAIRANPELVAQGLEAQLLDVERKLAETTAQLQTETEKFTAEVQEARARTDVELAEILAPLKDHKAELEALQAQITAEQARVAQEEARVGELLDKEARAKDRLKLLGQTVETLLAAQQFGQTEIEIEPLRWATEMQPQIEKLRKALEAQMNLALSESLAGVFDVNRLAPNVTLTLTLSDPKKFRRLGFLWTTGIGANLLIKAKINIGIRASDSALHKFDVAFSGGHLSKSSVARIGHFVGTQIVPKMKRVHEIYANSENVFSSARECLDLIRGVPVEAEVEANAASSPNSSKIKF